MSKYDITGQKFGYLTVLERDTSTIGEKNSKWICKCECGSVKTYLRCSLVSGHTKSCGCKKHDPINVTHGMSKTRIFGIWCRMRQRCNNPNPKEYKIYKSRGITVCEEWQEDFMSFYEWSINNGYGENLTIDRIDNNKGYSPENCRWITNAEQQRNKRTNIRVIYNGEDMLLIDVCEKLNLPYKRIHKRYRKFKLSNNTEFDINKILY